MGDIYQEIYAPRLRSSDPQRSCLALHPDGSVTTVTQRQVDDAWRNMIAGSEDDRLGIPEMGHLQAMDVYGYNLFFFAAYSRDSRCQSVLSNPSASNPPAAAFHRACCWGHQYAPILPIYGSMYISDDNRDLKLSDWKLFKHCWRSQTKDVKSKSKRARDKPIVDDESSIRQRVAALQAAKTSRSVVYIDATQKRCLELSLSKRDIVLLAHPLMDSMEGTGFLDSAEHCSSDPDLCLDKYSEELAVVARLRSFQAQHDILDAKAPFRPDVAVPMHARNEGDRSTFVWLQSDSVGSFNKVATKLLRMKVLGDAIVTTTSGPGLKDTTAAHVDCILLEQVKDAKNTCALCGAYGTKLCSRCGYTCYCSAECQHNDWPTHKGICVDVETIWTT